MRRYSHCLLICVVFLIPLGSSAQERWRPVEPNLLARLSYDTPVSSEETARQLCVAVNRDGGYRIVRVLPTGATERRRGIMPKDELQRLAAVLDSPEFLGLSSHGGLIRQQGESFGAEILTPDSEKGHRLYWVITDEEKPFPSPIAKVVTWLKHFDPAGGTEFESADFPDVCPSGGLRLLQPSVAGNLKP
jgi:hypothetical protein